MTADLTGKLPPGTAQKIRITTNLQIYGTVSWSIELFRMFKDKAQGHAACSAGFRWCAPISGPHGFPLEDSKATPPGKRAIHL